MHKTASAISDEIESIWATADGERRSPTAEEREYVSDLVDEARSRHEIEQRMKELGGGATSVATDPRYPPGGGDLGAQFVRSREFKAVQQSRGQQFSTGAVELDRKGTLLEGAGSPGAGSGGGLLQVPQVVAGVVETLFQPRYLESLLLAGQATGNTVRYAYEGTATSGAQGVAEGGTKPESTLGYGVRDEQVKKVATSIIVSDELLQDSAAVQTLVNGRLSDFVQNEVERELLRGTAGGNEVQGLLTSRGVPVYAAGTAAGNKAVQIFKAMNGLRGSAFLEPSWLMVHPTDYEQIRLLTDSSGNYLGGGPFQGPYGSGQQVSASGQITGSLDLLWNKPMVVSPIIGAGTALVGTREAAQVWSKGGPVVEASNSHSDLFVKDLVAIRAERRLALTVYRPSGFVEVRLA